VAAVGLYLALILFGYDKADPGWSQAAAVDAIANPGGRFGAWFADLMLYLFGVSAWWWVLLLFLSGRLWLSPRQPPLRRRRPPAALHRARQASCCC